MNNSGIKEREINEKITTSRINIRSLGRIIPIATAYITGNRLVIGLG